MRILSSSHIGFQDTADRVEWLKNLKPINSETEFVTPNWADRIDPRLLRRMSPILRMSSFAANEALEFGQQDVEAIIVGTGLGCTDDTLAFLNEMNTTFDSVLSPTAFIRSTHNTVAGQIALLMKNQGYNMTMTQGSLSFERSLIDAKAAMIAGEFSSALVGAVDELSDSVKSVLTDLVTNENAEIQLGQGSSFFVISNADLSDGGISGENSPPEKSLSRNFGREYPKGEGVFLSGITTCINGQSDETTQAFIMKYGTPDLVLNGSSLEFDQPSINYKDYCGECFSASGFAVFLASNIIETGLLPAGKPADSISKILISSGFGNELGLIMVEKR